MSDSMFSRRRLGQLSLATAAALALKPVVCQAAEAGWIDAHVHVWTPDLAAYPLAEGFKPSDMQPPSFTPQQLFAHTQPAGVTRVVLIQMSYYRYDNRYMLDVIAKHPGVFSGVAIVDHQAADLAEQVDKLAAGGVRGFRIHPQAGEASRWVESSAMGRLWKLAAAANLAICPLINPSDLPHIASLCRQYPDTQIVIDHFARIGISGQIEAEPLQALCNLAEQKQVHVKTSAFYALGKKEAPYHDLLPMIRQLLDAYGPQRLMWASDCPFQVEGGHSYDDSIALIRDASPAVLSEQDKEWLLRRTAEKVFF